MTNETQDLAQPAPEEAKPEVLDIFAEFATDEDAEDNGTWFTMGAARFLVARSGNREYTKAMSRLIAEHGEDLRSQDGRGAQKLSDQIMAEVFATTLLKGWQNVAYKGRVIEYSIENAKILLAHRDFRRAIASFADSMTAFKLKEEVEQGEA